MAIFQAKLGNLIRVIFNRVRLFVGNVNQLAFVSEAFDKVVAFETVYYWPNLEANFREVHRVLKTDGEFLICNEDYKKEDNPTEHDYLKALLPINIYSNDEIIEALKTAGFKKITLYLHHNGDWVSFVALK